MSVSVSVSAIARAIESAGILPISADTIMAAIRQRDARGITYMLTPADASPKLAHNGGHVSVVSAVQYLRPQAVAGFGNVCVAAGIECKGCYAFGGRAAFDPRVDVARQARMQFRHEDNGAYLAAIAGEIACILASANAADGTPAVRLNGLSDIMWERVPVGDAASFMDAFPAVRFWDYTRVPGRVDARNRAGWPVNYDLTFSLGSDNDRTAARALESGMKVAAVFRKPMSAASWHGVPVIDGDAHDFRFLESGPAIVALKAKGPARKDATGWVRDTDSTGLALERAPRFGRG